MTDEYLEMKKRIMYKIGDVERIVTLLFDVNTGLRYKLKNNGINIDI